MKHFLLIPIRTHHLKQFFIYSLCSSKKLCTFAPSFALDGLRNTMQKPEGGGYIFMGKRLHDALF